MRNKYINSVNIEAQKQIVHGQYCFIYTALFSSPRVILKKISDYDVHSIRKNFLELLTRALCPFSTSRVYFVYWIRNCSIVTDFDNA
jgi:hypothetical protein